MKKYNHRVIEKKWQVYWEKIKLFKAEKDPGKEKYYCLTMYPYPSGVLHVGHVINYTLGDALVRYHIIKGESVLSPMGWDSFGLPAENAAIREHVEPAEFTYRNIHRMKQQMKRAGWGYDWDREVATSHPGYYKWTQWIFLQLFKNGLAFKKEASANWCSSCNTVLANEQVIHGECERCSTPIEQKQLNQWFFKMSAYAQRLLDNHKHLRGNWPDRVLKMQEEWIGRSDGALIDFEVEETGETISIFTTRPDTLFGVTFLAIAPQHPLLEKLLAGKEQERRVMEVVSRLKKQTVTVRNIEEIMKEGIDTGIHIINPVNGDRIPLWAGNFVLMEYGTGIVMAVPGHDQRDFEFAREYHIPIKVVIQPEGQELIPEEMEQAYVDDGIMVNAGECNGLPNREGMKVVTELLQKMGKGKPEVNYKLKDWLISRQRYWGAPIPIVYCEECGTVPVPEEDLPVLLPENVEFRPTGESPLERCEEFLNTKCPVCGKPCLRETDTMDTFVDSSWYFLRYLNPREADKPFIEDDVEHWMVVDQYIGGIEHATMHLVYFRFLMMALKDLGYISFGEPAQKLFCQGMVCKVAYYCQKCKWVAEDDVNIKDLVCRKCNGEVTAEMAKISKTKLNTVDPDEIMDEYGADTLRLNILSDNPPDQEQVWSDESVKGANKFLSKLYDLIIKDLDDITREEASIKPAQLTGDDKELVRKTHQTIIKVTKCFEENFHFNTAIASIYELINRYKAAKDLSLFFKRETVKAVLMLLCPITPHICEELWEKVDGGDSIFKEKWPVADREAAAEETVEIVIQINGKIRSKIVVSASASKDELKKAAVEDEKIKMELNGRSVKRVVVVPSRLVNIVI